MSWSSRSLIGARLSKVYYFFLSVQCIEYTFKIYILLHTKKLNFIHFFACLFMIVETIQYILKIVTGNFPMLYCCKDYKNFTSHKKFLPDTFFVWFSGPVSSFLKYKKFFKLEARKKLSSCAQEYFTKYLNLFVSTTRRRDIKIPLCLSAPVWESLIQ